MNDNQQNAGARPPRRPPWNKDETRYLLLKANCDGAECDLMLQPWLVVDQPDLLTSDLRRDWLGSLNELGLTHMSERLDDLAGGSPVMPSDRILFSPRRSKKRGV